MKNTNTLTNNIKNLKQLNKQLKSLYKDIIINLEKLNIQNNEINKYKQQFITDIKQNNIDFPDIYIPEIVMIINKMIINNMKNLDINQQIDVNKLTKQNKKIHINTKNNIIQVYYPPKYEYSYILIITLTTENIIKKITIQKIKI